MTELVPEWRIGSLVLTDFPFAVVRESSVDYGAPENVTQVIRWLLDGEIEVSDRTGNRSVTLPVLIDDSDLAALADAEAALVAECDKARNEVYCDPGDGFGLPFVFDVFRGQIVFARNDSYEQAGYRAYTLTFRSLPFTRPPEQTTLTLAPTTIGTARQKSYTFNVPGSARTEASLHVETTSLDTAVVLGKTLIYTRPGVQGMIPLRQYRDGGGSGSGTTAAATNVSGRYDNDINADPFTALVPKTVVPDGTYIVLARVTPSSSTTDTTLITEVTTQVNGSPVRGVETFETPVTFTSGYALVQLGTAFQLPAAVVPDPTNATVQVVISDVDLGVVIRLDNAWLVEIGSGALTWPDTSDTFAPEPRHVWVDPANVDRSYRRVLRGLSDGQTDAFGAETFSWGVHVLAPGENSAFVVTDADDTSVLNATCFDRWHTHRGSP